MPRKTPVRKKKNNKIEIDQILLNSRQVFLFDDVNEDSAKEINMRLLALDKMSTDPILLYINSPGGCVDSGL